MNFDGQRVECIAQLDHLLGGDALYHRVYLEPAVHCTSHGPREHFHTSRISTACGQTFDVPRSFGFIVGEDERDEPDCSPCREAEPKVAPGMRREIEEILGAPVELPEPAVATVTYCWICGAVHDAPGQLCVPRLTTNRAHWWDLLASRC